MIQKVLFATLFWAVVPTAHAVDIYTLVTANCVIHKGVITFVSENEVELISLEGQGLKVPRSGIEFITLHTF